MTQPTQLSLFSMATFNTMKPQKEAMHEAAKNCGLSREEIVDKMNNLADQFGVNLVKGNGKLSLPTFEKWINPEDKSREMPMRAVSIFCAVVKDYSAISILTEPLGIELAGPEKQKLLRFSEGYLMRREANKIMKENDPGS